MFTRRRSPPTIETGEAEESTTTRRKPERRSALVSLLAVSHLARYDQSKLEKLTRLEEIESKVILLRMVGMNSPPRVDEDVEAREEKDEEGRRPLGFESDDDHDTGSETKEGDDDSSEGPLPLEDESDEEEDEQDSAGELEAD